MRVFLCKNILKKKPTLKTMWVFVDIYVPYLRTILNLYCK